MRPSPGLIASLVSLASLAVGSPLVAQEVRSVSLRHAAERTPEGRSAHQGEQVRVRGVVSVGSRAFFGELFKVYIQDEGVGLCVFARRSSVPLEPGDLVEVEGRLQSFNGVVQLAVSSVAMKGRGEPPAPLRVAPEELVSPRHSGLLVETEGTVVGDFPDNNDAFNVSLAAGRQVLLVHLTRKQRAEFPRDVWQRGATLRIRGVASQFDRSLPADSGWQILPRTASDVELVRSPPLFTAGQAALAATAILGLLVAVAGWNVLLRREVRRRTLELQRSASGLEAANRSLREAIRLRDEVVSIVSHEFRSPLTVIQGYSETLAQRVGDEELRRAFRIIHRHAKQLAALATDTLTMSRMEAGSLRLASDPVDLAELLRARVEARGSDPSVQIALDVPGTPLTVRGDYDRLVQVVDNLVDNAIKYSPDGPGVRVTLRQTPEGALVSVADQGISIRAEDMPRLFQKFSRLDAARERHIPGTGLGLYICRCIVEAHGGRIWGESGGVGATFHFVLPTVDTQPG